MKNDMEDEVEIEATTVDELKMSLMDDEFTSV